MPGLRSGTRWTTTSQSGRLTLAGIHHDERAAPRRYVHRTETAVLTYDGFPLLPIAEAWDAGRLAERWNDLPGLLEGSAAVIRAELATDAVEIVTDPVGMLRVYRASLEDGGYVVSNSLLALRHLLERAELDEEAAADFVTLGWVVGRGTLVRDVEVVPGGAVTTIGVDRIESRPYFGLDTLAPRVQTRRRPLAETVDALCALLHPLRAADIDVRAALTAGRDSRVTFALLRHAGVDAVYFTGGDPNEPDVQIAALLARRFGVQHEIDVPADLLAGDIDDAIRAFVDHTDGLASFEQLRDVGGILANPTVLPVTVSGVGGELARSGTGNLAAFAANAWPLARVEAFQLRVLEAKARSTIASSDALAATRGRIRSELTAYREAGWPTAGLGDAFYLFQRIGRWAVNATRSASASGDLVAPLVSRPFIEAAVAGAPADHYAESLHRALLRHVDPALPEIAFEVPWRTGHARLAPVLVMRDAVALARLKVGRPPPFFNASWENHVAAVWQAQRPLHEALLARTTNDRLFTIVDRGSFADAVAGSSPPAPDVQRALSLLWAFSDDAS